MLNPKTTKEALKNSQIVIVSLTNYDNLAHAMDSTGSL